MRQTNLIALAVPFFFLLIGVELLVARLQGLRAYRLNDAVTDMSCGIGQQIVTVFLKTAMFGVYALVYEHARLFDLAPWPVAAWTVAILGVDVVYYWWHRLSHEVAFMWAIHVVHHQSEDYNLAVALRQAWFSGVSSMPFYLPLALAGVPPVVFVSASALNTLYQFWIHTRTIGKLGPLELAINTPSHHRVHHGRDPKYLDRNYAGMLIVWDRVFGSFQEEEEEPRYGTIAPYASWNPIYANFDFWRELVRRARATPRLADKVRVFFESPGWTPPGVEPYETPDATPEALVRYETEVPRGVASYVIAQIALAIAASVVLMSGRAPLWLAAPLAVWVLAGTMAWGGLFERKAWAAPLEAARLGAAGAAFGAAALADAVPLGIGVAVALAAMSLAAWALLLPRLARERLVQAVA